MKKIWRQITSPQDLPCLCNTIPNTSHLCRLAPGKPERKACTLLWEQSIPLHVSPWICFGQLISISQRIPGKSEEYPWRCICPVSLEALLALKRPGEVKAYGLTSGVMSLCGHQWKWQWFRCPSCWCQASLFHTRVCVLKDFPQSWLIALLALGSVFSTSHREATIWSSWFTSPRLLPVINILEVCQM